jgi:hypothetical protein
MSASHLYSDRIQRVAAVTNAEQLHPETGTPSKKQQNHPCFRFLLLLDVSKFLQRAPDHVLYQEVSVLGVILHLEQHALRSAPLAIRPHPPD